MASFSQFENEKLKAFPIFPGGMRYMPKIIRNKAMFPILFQNFLEEKLTLNWTCKSDDMFPKKKKKKPGYLIAMGNQKGNKNTFPLL
ncbi:hypothetical protein DVH24_021286 [Malus domestica]|uniref:Uncharacterized protein n=1 Tax=Malus domestica TaxID=3750 RepID=A0A498HRN1_MALDO|nr:hypothetical protein DVH24_021286 [Malus domestica]